MKIGTTSTAVLFCVSLMGLAMPCLANEPPTTGQYKQKTIQEEATVVSIEQNNVTLQIAGERERKVAAHFGNAGEFKVGDRVVVVGNTLKKCDNSLTDKAPANGSTTDTTSVPPTNRL